jgi:hypothetical protein
MANFYSKFPIINYNINRGADSVNNFTGVTNILFRFGFLTNILKNSAAYEEYIIKDGETPEMLADRFYGNPEAHWVIMLANNIIDPHYDWPLDNRSFDDFIVNKYGSFETAQTTYHHWEKVVTRKDSFTGDETVQKFQIDEADVGADNLDVPYDNYTDQAVSVTETYDIGNGSSCIETITKDRVTFYDYEFLLNEARRTIKIIDPGYYPQINEEFNRLVSVSGGNRLANYGLRALR